MARRQRAAERKAWVKISFRRRDIGKRGGGFFFQRIHIRSLPYNIGRNCINRKLCGARYSRPAFLEDITYLAFIDGNKFGDRLDQNFAICLLRLQGGGCARSTCSDQCQIGGRFQPGCGRGLRRFDRIALRNKLGRVNALQLPTCPVLHVVIGNFSGKRDARIIPVRRFLGDALAGGLDGIARLAEKSSSQDASSSPVPVVEGATRLAFDPRVPERSSDPEPVRDGK